MSAGGDGEGTRVMFIIPLANSLWGREGEKGRSINFMCDLVPVCGSYFVKL